MDELNEAKQRAMDIRHKMQELHVKASVQRNAALKHNEDASKLEGEKRALFSEYQKAQTDIMLLEQE